MMDILIKDIKKSFGDKPVLSGFSAVFEAGAVSCVTGASGAGKTTLLRILMGLTRPDSGCVEGTQGQWVSAVFQEDRLIESMSAVNNVMMAILGKSDKKMVEEELIALGLGAPDIYAPVSALSGGMRRRVAIARALMARWDILLLDEPFKGLDDAVKEMVIDRLHVRREGRTVIMVTHDLREATRMGASVFNIDSL